MKSSLTGRSRQQDRILEQLLIRGQVFGERKYGGSAKLLLLLFDTQTSNIVQYAQGSSTNPSVRTVDLQIVVDFIRSILVERT